LLDVGHELLDRPLSAAGDPEHARNLADGHLDTDARQEADQDRARQKIRQKS
jgi:hypothetical protein